MFDDKNLAILTYIRSAKEGRRWIDCENEFVKERGWSKGTYIKYWKEALQFLEKKPDPKRPGRFRYFVRQEFEIEPEKAMLRRRIKESKVLAEGSMTLPDTFKEKFLKALGDVITENVYGNPFKACDLITNLKNVAPPEFKKRINPYFAAAKKVYNERPYRDPFSSAIYMKTKIVPFLIDKFSSLLYETE